MTAGHRIVQISEYDSKWPRLFDEERNRLLAVAGDKCSEILHAGSTSVPGLAAKPIVDIVVVLRERLSDSETELFCEAGFEYRGEQNVPGRQYFSRRSAPACHLHCIAPGEASEEYRAEIEGMVAFRDHLRVHHGVAREYESLKRELAARYHDDRVAYTDAKTDFVKSTTAIALADATWKLPAHRIGRRLV